jgi:hypothetical protein
VGGKAVYKARSYMYLVNDTIVYDDEYVCSQAGFRKGKNVKEEKGMPSDIQIIPNLANDKVTVQLTGIDDGICKIQIRNMLNEIIYDDIFNCKEQKHIINVSNLRQGVYSITVNAANKKSVINKLIIER